MARTDNKQPVMFRLLDGLASCVYYIREYLLTPLNDKLDQQAARHYKE